MVALASELGSMTLWEGLAALLALAYLVLAIRESLWCWPAAFLSTAIYTVLFWEGALLSESLLNVYYMGMALYGYWSWRFGGRRHHGVQIHAWPLARHAALISGTAILGLGVGYLMDTYTHAEFAWLDAQTTCFSIVTTWLVARKVLENWLYWIVINLVSMYLFLNKGFVLTTALYVLYFFLAIEGYRDWRRTYREHA